MHDTLEQSRVQQRARLLDWLGGQQQAMQDLLHRIVDIDSGSRDEAGILAVAQALRERLEAAEKPLFARTSWRNSGMS